MSFHIFILLKVWLFLFHVWEKVLLASSKENKIEKLLDNLSYFWSTQTLTWNNIEKLILFFSVNLVQFFIYFGFIFNSSRIDLKLNSKLQINYAKVNALINQIIRKWYRKTFLFDILSLGMELWNVREMFKYKVGLSQSRKSADNLNICKHFVTCCFFLWIKIFNFCWQSVRSKKI